MREHVFCIKRAVLRGEIGGVIDFEEEDFVEDEDGDGDGG